MEGRVNWAEAALKLCSSLEAINIDELRHIAREYGLPDTGTVEEICRRFMQRLHQPYVSRKRYAEHPAELVLLEEEVLNIPLKTNLSKMAHSSLRYQRQKIQEQSLEGAAEVEEIRIPSESSFMGLVPPEVVKEMLAYLPAQDLLHVKRTSKRYMAIASKALDERLQKLRIEQPNLSNKSAREIVEDILGMHTATWKYYSNYVPQFLREVAYAIPSSYFSDAIAAHLATEYSYTEDKLSWSYLENVLHKTVLQLRALGLVYNLQELYCNPVSAFTRKHRHEEGPLGFRNLLEWAQAYPTIAEGSETPNPILTLAIDNGITCGQ